MLNRLNQWWLTRDTGMRIAKAWPAYLVDVRKHRGCCYYSGTGVNWPMNLTKAQCLDLFGLYPKSSQLLYVKQQKNGKWKSEEIDLDYS